MKLEFLEKIPTQDGEIDGDIPGSRSGENPRKQHKGDVKDVFEIKM